MSRKQRTIDSSVLIILALISSALFAVSIPDYQVLDYFEAPKRALMSLIPIVLLLWNAKQSKNGSLLFPGLFVCALVAWFTFGRGFSIPTESEIWLSWMLPPLLFYAGLTCTSSSIPLLTTGLTVLGSIQALIMLGQFGGVQLFNINADTSAAAMIGTLGYHNHAASFLTLCIGLALNGALQTSRRFFRIIYFAMSALLTVTTALTGSRGTFLGLLTGLIAGGMVLLPRWKRLKTRTILLATVLPITFLLIAGIPVLMRAVAGPPSDPVYGFNSRAIMWKAAINLFREHPFFGNGAGGFACDYMRQLAAILPAEKTHLLLQSVVYAREPHNDSLYFLAEFGLIGVALLLPLFGFIALRIGRQIQHGNRTNAATALFILAYITTHSLVSFPWHYPVTGPLAGLLTGIFLGDIPTHSNKKRHGHIVLLRLLYSGLLAISCAVALCGVIMAFNHRYLLDPETSVISERMTPRMHGLLGSALFSIGKQEEGLQHMETAWWLSPDPLLANNLGTALTKCNRLTEAEQVYRLWAESGLVHSQALYNLCITLENLQQYDLAEKNYVRLQTLWPEQSEWITVRRIDLAMRTEHPYKVIELAVPYLEYPINRNSRHLSFSNHVHVLNFAAAAYLKTQQIEQAVHLLDTILAVDPDNIMAQRNRHYIRFNHPNSEFPMHVTAPEENQQE